MEKEEVRSAKGSLRWKILRLAISSGQSSLPDEIKRISRKTDQGFGLIPYEKFPESIDVRVRYANPKITIVQRAEGVSNLHNFRISNAYKIDNTGLVCNWPSEEVLAHFCLKNAELFRSKRVIEVGSGYGLAGLAVAAATDASEVVISDGNPLVVEYIQRNIEENRGAFDATEVRSALVHWDQDEAMKNLGSFDYIIASDCTFFKEFHKALVRCIKSLLRNDEDAEALFFSPRRGDSLEKFLSEVEEGGLHARMIENYDDQVWERHQGLIGGGGASWPGYEPDHCYPYLIRIKR